MNAWECLVGCPCVGRIRNVKSVVKCLIFLKKVKENKTAGKSDALPVESTATPKRTEECMQETGVHVANLVVVQDNDGHE